MATVAPELQPLCLALHDAIVALHPTHMEVVWLHQGIASYGVGPKKMSEHYAYIAPQKSHVNLGFYWGTGLPDASGVMEGKGKRLRHIKIKNLEMAHSAPTMELLRHAINERQSYRA
jgi:hypothetical protein